MLKKVCGGDLILIRSECHCHFVLDGADFRRALAVHRGADEAELRRVLAAYRDAGVLRLRDGGDNLGACLRAKTLAPEYGIDLRVPSFAIHKNGLYGALVGRGFDTLSDYASLVARAAADGADFIKLMVSGIVDFAQFGVLSCPSLPAPLVREMVHIAHESGLRVMAHANGEAVRTALECGADSVEHGYFAPPACAALFAQTGAVYVPTLATCGNLIGAGRFPDEPLRRIHEDHCAFAAQCAEAGALVASGSDAGAWRVPHPRGVLDELAYLRALGLTDDAIGRANDAVFDRFRAPAA